MTINTNPDIHNLIICANMFVKKDNKILMIKRSSDKKYLPGYIQPVGGKVELNEDPLTAAQRELKEESGLTARDIKLEAVITEVIQKDDNLYKTTWLIYYFSGTYMSGNLGETDEGELIWLTKDQIRNEKILTSLKSILNEILTTTPGTVFAKFVYDNKYHIIDKQIQKTTL